MATKLEDDNVKNQAPAFLAADYNRVVQSANLLSVQLIKTDFNVDEKFFDHKIKRSLVMNREYLKFVFDKKQKVVAGEFRFSFQTKGPVESVLSSSAEYLVIYEFAENDVNEAAAIDFCKRVGVFAAYPYYRALVAHLSWATNTNLPPMPVIATRGSLVKDASALNAADSLEALAPTPAVNKRKAVPKKR